MMLKVFFQQHCKCYTTLLSFDKQFTPVYPGSTHLRLDISVTMQSAEHCDKLNTFKRTYLTAEPLERNVSRHLFHRLPSL